MDPTVWGPHAWIFLHSIALAYPSCPSKEDKDKIKNFFTDLENIIPCDKCRSNYKNHITKYPLTDKILCSKENLVKWSIDIHNSVNKMLGKPELSYEEALNHLFSMYNKSNNYTILYGSLALLLVLFTILIVLLILKLRNRF